MTTPSPTPATPAPETGAERIGWNARQYAYDALFGDPNFKLPADQAEKGFKIGAEHLTEYFASALAAKAAADGAGEDEAYEIGKRDGYDAAVQEIDLLTGGDGEYFASTLPGRGCPDAAAMKVNIAERFVALSRPAPPAPDPQASDVATLYARRVTIPYTNWQGEFDHREIAPIRIFWGLNQWHKKPQWLIEAWDIAKAAIRTFALTGIGAPAPDRQGFSGDVPDGWQDISKAPEDGREVLAGFQGQYRWLCFIAFCHPKTHGGVQQSGYAKPTHWRPLPPPPATRHPTKTGGHGGGGVMTTKQARLIERMFQAAWDEFGDDKSTEFLISITADRLGIEYMDVVDALAMVNDDE